MTKTIKITMSTNALASSPSKVEALIPGLYGAKHNGGKVVVATVTAADLAAVEEALDSAYQVIAYEVR